MFQDEIQSAHRKQDQVSLLTAAIWFDGKLHPKVIVSDNLDHGKGTVVAYIDYLLNTLPAPVKTVSIWSDGPSSQFKNKYIYHCSHTSTSRQTSDGIILLHPMEKGQFMELVVR